jgi:hypothetical protein
MRKSVYQQPNHITCIVFGYIQDKNKGVVLIHVNACQHIKAFFHYFKITDWNKSETKNIARTDRNDIVKEKSHMEMM